MKEKKRVHPVETETTRRSFVVGTIGTVTAAALSAACGSDSESTSKPGSGGAAGGGATGGGGTSAGGTSAGGTSAGGTSAGGAGGATGGAGGGGSCTVYPEEMLGPYYLDLDLVRSDITEGKPGTPLVVTMIVQAAG